MAIDSSRYHELTLIDRTDFTDDLAVFHLQAEKPIEFTPGQYATIGVLNDAQDRTLLRPYSVVSAPGSTDVEIFIERVEGGALTSRLWKLEQGASVWMRKKIVGRFVLDTSCRHHVMAATVTGVGPYVSIARNQHQALQSGRQTAPHQLLIIHGGSRSWELGTYRRELTALAEEVDWLQYVPTVSRPWEDPNWTGESGRVEDVLRKHMDATDFPHDDTAVYTCGHPQMIEKAQGIFERTGVPDDRIHEEKYFVEGPGSTT